MLKKFLVGFLAIVIAIVGIAIVVANEKTAVLHPKGIIAYNILNLIITNGLLMFLIIVPTYILLFAVVWKYCIKKGGEHDPDYKYGPFGELVMWLLPSIIVAIMAVVTWEATYQLDPYKPLESEKKPLLIQVVALDWKWLFIYPELGIATLNYFHIPEQTPVHLRLTADGAPMNSFWIPQLSGQIYSMTGMSTQIHMMADGPGEYRGREVEINGKGYSDMTFVAKSTSVEDFENWVAEVKNSPLHLTHETYADLVKPAVDSAVRFFSQVPENLYHHIVHKYMYPAKPVL